MQLYPPLYSPAKVVSSLAKVVSSRAKAVSSLVKVASSHLVYVETNEQPIFEMLFMNGIVIKF